MHWPCNLLVFKAFLHLFDLCTLRRYENALVVVKHSYCVVRRGGDPVHISRLSNSALTKYTNCNDVPTRTSKIAEAQLELREASAALTDLNKAKAPFLLAGCP